MIMRQIKLSNWAKDKLSRLKGKTGIQNWNILCRWALCLSLSEPSIPPDVDIPADSNVEMSWQVFGGEYQELYKALMVQRCICDGLGSEPETLAKYFKLHLNRGIAYLSGTNVIRSCDDLLMLAIDKYEKGSIKNDCIS